MCAAHLAFLLLSVIISHGKRTYTIQAQVSPGSCLCYPSSPDQLYLRICYSSECSTFLSLPGGLPSSGDYTFYITTPTDIGTINKVQIVHMGDDQLCLDHVKVDGVEYDESVAPWCWSSGSSSTSVCSTLTITSANDWSSSISNPCEFTSMFGETYQPTPSPTNQSEIPTLSPTKNPTIEPTSNPTKLNLYESFITE